ncbi:hypothetical protein FEM48_Zijuj09G0157800 [Ziziphus jujuba var. spinosa]|uniref:Chitin-binding type-1 domain-containing protein n=1 Tax=Ziziphus jujuba var. spinosa TaxID=714518 RepID=A0A978UTW0_ZIZJJ|nr:hypothetical protein FEM48_Zijuj09G0157800 [Ziziphus jujuba var. spinosa]
MKFWGLTIVSLLLFTIQGGSAEQCGRQAGGALCPGGQCCSKYGWCGTTPDYCNNECQSQCSGSDTGGGDIPISRSTFDEMFKHRNDCPSKSFYSYDAFIAAAKAFPGFGTTGDDATRKKEIAAFLAQTSHETTDLVASDAVISFKTAIWFWMTPQWPKPSCHDVITGRWSPSSADWAAGRAPGYGVITNIINGGLECGKGWNDKVDDRIGFYKRYCDLLHVGYGDNLDCYNQRHFGSEVLVDTM